VQAKYQIGIVSHSAQQYLENTDAPKFRNADGVYTSLMQSTNA